MLTDNTRGALLMMASMAGFTLNDTFMKALSGEMPLFQLIFLRGILTTLAIGVMAWYVGALHLRIPPRDRALITLRMVAEIGSAYFFLTALYNMPLANVSAIMQSLPLVVTLAAALFFGEPLGWRRMTAILVGLGGVLLIVRPGGEGFTIFSIYALIAVAFVTLRDLVTRRVSGATHSMMVTFTTSLGLMLAFGVASLGVDWVPMDLYRTGMTVGASVMVVFGYVFSVMVMRVGEISFVAPFRYTGLIWALLLGWLVFGDWPAPLTLIGAAIVVGSGVFTLYREGQLKRRIAAEAKLRTGIGH
ncbi:MAG: DMT family transporter [Paracoccaceae bacterium]|uniref:DMT family transporter n=1 Tax=Seohaeicola saemankumensis TaxID=481181 RepID=UPI001E311E88|nr:DMT family transporter [Seohaeicola saemankumensis]MCD1628167.1 DMT family transporter [Seohaeicola saemankumensis]